MLDRRFPAGVWAVDFEFTAPPGEQQIPICMVARELGGGQTLRVWHDEFGPEPPFPIGPDALLVAYYASAELGCFRTLGWPRPERIDIGDDHLVRNDLIAKEQGTSERTINRSDAYGAPFTYVGGVKYRPIGAYRQFLASRIQRRGQPRQRRGRR